jgi:hypothetical protein
MFVTRPLTQVMSLYLNQARRPCSSDNAVIDNLTKKIREDRNDVDL